MDDAELVRRLRLLNEVDANVAADRIEGLVAERDAARDAALEEAAKAIMPGGLISWSSSWYEPALRAAQNRVRALKGKSHE